MSITQNIPRKQGRTPSPGNIKPASTIYPIHRQPGTSKPVTGFNLGAWFSDAFGFKGRTLANVGANGKTYASPLTESTKHPLGTYHNTATQVVLPALTVSGPTGMDDPAHAVDVAPHEKGTFFGKQFNVILPQRVSGGVDKKSDTAWHPNKKVDMPQRPVRRPATAGERTNERSFLQPSHQSNAHLTGFANNDPIGSRWNVVKRGAAG